MNFQISPSNLVIVQDLIIEDMQKRMTNIMVKDDKFNQSKLDELAGDVTFCGSIDDIMSLCNQHIDLFDNENELADRFHLDDAMNYVIGLFVHEVERYGIG